MQGARYSFANIGFLQWLHYKQSGGRKNFEQNIESEAYFQTANTPIQDSCTLKQMKKLFKKTVYIGVPNTDWNKLSTSNAMDFYNLTST